MNESNRKKLLYTVLVAAIIWAWLNTWSDMGDKSKLEPEPAFEPIAAVAPTGRIISPSAVFDTTALAALDWGPDPFVRRGKPPRSQASAVIWVLTGISYSERSPVAFINQQIVKIGDRVDNAVVIDIGKSSVTLEHRGNRFELTVTEG